ncbi:helix-turn-helix domain-containing protein [Listeria seeligeri]|uniref:helix-turn-helix domain-containing protein n=1 Tax=Listeria seeligeri TaxID=1640 RepID=UPI001627E503|nr:Rgg/GadR/MutR family transcriptional regulator [Listeria seeligeri]MBC1534020.1 helix-turn-helix domain-containing protein [Listeria seeligeri]MBC1739442.1 helix-turn-helix domain-containing protein [Listeria seeligeri]MBC1747905.1 helix-turn-helix domain-containing protein [Listeria seeligeri]MBC1820408.1 helix-turn-helix domain-containing protein [Listeria seeligeri]MBC1834560.1 helix-turn-helix domain-containing protein [Listeria seeligeri]
MKNTKTIGRALRDIRKIKGMTQNDIVTTNLTRSSIAKIETDKVNPSYGTITTFANQLGVSLEEVLYYQNNYMIPEKEKIIYEFRNLRLSSYDNPIIILIEKIDLYLEKYKDIQIIELKAVLEASQIFTLTDNVELARKKVDFIWERLEKQDEWFYFDVLLLSNIIYVFDSEIIVDVGMKIMKEIEKFSYNVQSKRLKMSIALNLGLFLKIADKMDLAIEFIEMGIELAKQNEDLVVEYLAYYRKSEFLLYKGHFKEAEKLYNKSVQFYEFIGNQIMLKDIKNDWLNYNKKLKLG